MCATAAPRLRAGAGGVHRRRQRARATQSRSTDAEAASVWRVPAERLVGARHPGVGIPAARSVSRQELRHDDLTMGRDARGARAVPRAGVRAGRGRSSSVAVSRDANSVRARGAIDLRLEVDAVVRADARGGSRPARRQPLEHCDTSTGRWRSSSRTTPATGATCGLAISLALARCLGRRANRAGVCSSSRWRGTEPIDAASGETRRFLEDGDEVMFRGWCEREGAARIGLGECRGVVTPARAVT